MVLHRFILFTNKAFSRVYQSSRSITHHLNASREFFRRDNIPPIALVIGCVALSFQVGVLYPWHEVISEDFHQLQSATNNLQVLASALDKKMDLVMQLEKEVKYKERKVLEREEEILVAENKILILSENLDKKINRVIDILEKNSTIKKQLDAVESLEDLSHI